MKKVRDAVYNIIEKHETVYVISGKLKVIGKSLKNEIIKFEKESKFNLRAFYLSQNGRIRENSLFRSKTPQLSDVEDFR